MFRKIVAGEKNESKDSINWRGHEVTRIEAFSDAVFAFAITLLIVALEVPKTYKELMECMAYFVPFAVCFTILFMVWYAQNMFFRRYGLHDFYTLLLNGILMFFVLFFVYPLKFLFSSIFSGHVDIENVQQLAKLFYIYSGGFTCIYLLLALMYYNALVNKEKLKLTPIELFETKSHLFSYLTIAFIGVCSIILAFLGNGFINFAGTIYILIGPSVAMLFTFRGKRKRNLNSFLPEPIDNTLESNEEPISIDTVEDDMVNR